MRESSYVLWASQIWSSSAGSVLLKLRTFPLSCLLQKSDPFGIERDTAHATGSIRCERQTPNPNSWRKDLQLSIGSQDGNQTLGLQLQMDHPKVLVKTMGSTLQGKQSLVFHLGLACHQCKQDPLSVPLARRVDRLPHVGSFFSDRPPCPETPNVLDVDSLSILFSHRSFQNPAISSGFFVVF